MLRVRSRYLGQGKARFFTPVAIGLSLASWTQRTPSIHFLDAQIAIESSTSIYTINLMAILIFISIPCPPVPAAVGACTVRRDGGLLPGRRGGRLPDGHGAPAAVPRPGDGGGRPATFTHKSQ